MAGFIKKLLPDKKVKQISFAKPLKDFCGEVFNIPKQNLYGSDADKNYPLCTWGEIFTGLCLRKYGKRDRDLLSSREILQVVGTDVMRLGHLEYLQNEYVHECNHFLAKKFGRGTKPFGSIWIDLALMDIKVLEANKELDIAVISDIRFHNERNAIQKAGGILVRLYRDTGCEDSIQHPSELELDEMKDADFDYVLFEQNNKNLKQLRAWTTNVLMSAGILEAGGLSI
jgi:hypothetical protein